MSASKELVSHMKDLLSPLGSVKGEPFFGGYSFKIDAKQFAMVMENTVYFCVNDTTRAQYEKLGMTSFSYSTKKGVIQVKKYYVAPEELFENQTMLIEWARQAIEAAHSYTKKKPVKKSTSV